MRHRVSIKGKRGSGDMKQISPKLGRFIPAILCGLTLSIVRPAPAQQGEPNSHPLPPELKRRAVSIHSHNPKGPAKKPGPVAQSDLGLAILVDVLGKLDDQADAHFHKGEYNHIVNLDRIIVQGDPRRADTYASAAWLLWSTDRNDEAIEFLKQGLKAVPDSYYMYDELGGHYYYRLKDPRSALPYYEKATSFPCPWATWHGLAHCYEKTNQWNRAASAWERATRYQNNPAAARNLQRVREQIARTRSGSL